jgi:hypothetical protein
MKVNSFNSKVNLPKLCAKLGHTGYQFVRIPTFGWYAYNQDMSIVANAFDLVAPKERDQLYALISKDLPEYLDFDLAYSNLSETKLAYNLLEIQLWSGALALARKEMETYKMTVNGKKTLIKDALIESGMSALMANKVGVISTEVLKQFDMLPWPKRDIRGKILLPSYATPKHICSLEYFSLDQPNLMLPLWINDEKGWYGSIEAGHVVSEMKDLYTTPGITWDYKADFWFGNKIITLDDQLKVDDCLRIWTDATNTVFEKSPLKQIVASGKLDELKSYVGKLNYTQLQQIEAETGEKLANYWKRARELQIQIGDKTFLKRDNRYYVYKKGNLMEVTNFALEFDKIVKKDGVFVRVGYIHYGNQTIPCEIEERFFTSNHLFQRGISEKFISAGIGVPLIHPTFTNKALLIVNSFNPDVKIVVE